MMTFKALLATRVDRTVTVEQVDLSEDQLMDGNVRIDVDYSTVTYKDGLAEAELESFLDQFIDDAIQGNGLGYVGGDDYGFICLDKRGSISEEQRASVEAWLKSRSELAEFTLSPLMDVWYPENPINPA